MRSDPHNEKPGSKHHTSRDRESTANRKAKAAPGKQAEAKYEVDKETLRRLRIQNKKLIEQVVRLKDEVKKVKVSRVEALVHLNALAKLINY